MHEREKGRIKTEGKIEVRGDREGTGSEQREGRERLEEKARMAYVKIMERRQEEAETNRHEERLHGKDGVEEVEDAHTHRGSGGQWG